MPWQLPGSCPAGAILPQQAAALDSLCLCAQGGFNTHLGSAVGELIDGFSAAVSSPKCSCCLEAT